MSRSTIPRSLREEVSRRDADACRYCRLAQFGQGATFHIDHIVPRSQGGVTDIKNLVLQCPFCSLHKADKIHAVDPVTGDRVDLFHPQRQEWGDHFRIEPDAMMVGITPIGRATIVALAMNDPIPVSARACAIALGLIG